MSLVTFTLHILEEKKSGRGEDAIVCQTKDPNAAIIACMDGCGGSGSSKYPQFNNWSGARIASRLAGNALADWFQENILPGKIKLKDSAKNIASNLEEYLRRRFLQAASLLGEADQESISRLSRIFPTTLAAVLIEVIGRNQCRIRSLWAGDSRTYYFPVTGLQQTSRDNTHGDLDPFDDLMRDGIMNNVICADRPFRIYSAEVVAKEPCMVLTATDGCFSYYLSPLYLEWVLLESLQHVNSPKEWERDLNMLFGRVSGDDYSMTLAVIGFRNFKALQRAYAPRWECFQMQYAQHLPDILERGDVEAHRALWDIYKKEYMPEGRE